MIDQYTHQDTLVPNPHRIHVRIHNPDTQEYEDMILVKHVGWVGGKGYVTTWQIEGTLMGFTPADLRKMYRLGDLLIGSGPGASRTLDMNALAMLCELAS